MDQHRILVFVGSLRRESINRQLALALAAMAPDGFTLEMPRIDDVPPYNQDQDAQPPEPVLRLKNAVRNADGIVFVTPEYNRSIPGVLKNVIDHVSRPSGQSAWAGKPAGVIGASSGAIGTAVAQQHLRVILAYLDVPTLGQPEAYIQHKPDLYGSDGRIANEGTRKFVQGWLDAYVAFVQAHGRDRMRARTA